MLSNRLGTTSEAAAVDPKANVGAFTCFDATVSTTKCTYNSVTTAITATSTAAAIDFTLNAGGTASDTVFLVTFTPTSSMDIPA